MLKLTQKIDKDSLIIFAITFSTAICLAIIYSDITNHEYLHWDDIFYVVNNPYLRDISFENIAWMVSDYKMLNWHPLTWFSYSLDFSLYGENPVFFKLTNIILHISNCFVLFFIFKIILDSTRSSHRFSSSAKSSNINTYTALLAACTFAIHPQHIESVVWVAERKDVLCSLFYFSSILSYMHYRTKNRRRYLDTALLFALLASMSKPMAVSLPVVLVLIDIFIFRLTSRDRSLPQNLRILVQDKILFFALAAFISIVTLFAQTAAIKDFETLSIYSRIINASIASCHYLISIIYPANLTPFYPFSEIASNPGYLSILPILLALAAIFVCILLWKKNHQLYLIALLFYAITILPVIGIITVGNQAYADRYTYIPTSFFYLALANSCVTWFFNSSEFPARRLILASSFTIFFLTLSAFSVTQIKDWRNDETLWSKVAQNYPGKVQHAHQNLGNTYLIQGRYKQATEQYKLALAINPDSSKIYENLGRAYAKLGDRKQEIAHYLAAIEKDKKAIWPRLLAGYFFLRHRKPDIAKEYFQQALKLAPDAAPVIVANAEFDIASQKLDSAKTRLEQLLELEPDYTDALWMLAQLYYAEGSTEKSRLMLEKILVLSPDNKAASNFLKKLYKSDGQA